MPAPVYNDEARHLPRQVELKFSFKLGTSGTSAPTIIRDGGGRMVSAVSSIASSLQTITFKTWDQAPGLRLPRQLTHATVQIHSASGATRLAVPEIVVDSYSASAGTLGLVYRLTSTGVKGTTGLAEGDLVCVVLCGPLEDFAKDAA